MKCWKCGSELTVDGGDGSLWRRMTPEEYAAQFRFFGPRRATVDLGVVNVAASAEVSVYLLQFTDVENKNL